MVEKDEIIINDEVTIDPPPISGSSWSGSALSPTRPLPGSSASVPSGWNATPPSWTPSAREPASLVPAAFGQQLGPAADTEEDDEDEQLELSCKALPLPCVSTVFASKAVPSPCFSTAFG